MLLEDETGFCPWHRKDSSFRRVASIHNATPIYSIPGRMHPDDRLKGLASRTGVLIYECMKCGKSLVLLETEVMPTGDDLTTYRKWRSMVSPHESPRALHESAPEKVRSLYAEASTCEKAGALRAAGVMYRATVEELVKDQGASEWGLKDKIKGLRGQVSDELLEDLHEARMLGDDSIHKGVAYTAEEVADVAELIEEAVLELYVQPAQKRAMRDARKARREGTKP